MANSISSVLKSFPPPKAIGSTALGDFHQCRRKYGLLLEHQARESSGALAIGIAVHEGLRAWAFKKDEEAAIVRAFEELKDRRDKAELEVVTSGLMFRYFEQYNNDRYKPVSTETELFIDTPYGVKYRATPDLVVDRHDGLWAVDYKTTSRTPEAFFRSYPMKSQMKGHVYAARTVLNLPVKGVIVDALYKNEKYKFQRLELTFTQDELDQWWLETCQAIKDIVAAHTVGEFYAKDGDHCWMHGAPCPFWTYCTSEFEPMVLKTTHIKRKVPLWKQVSRREGK